VKRKRGRPRKKTKDVVDAQGFAPNLDCLAQECGVTRQTIDNARKRFAIDAPRPTSDRRYHVGDYRAWLSRHGVTGRRKDAELVQERDVKLAHAQLRLERERFEFEQIKERMLPAGQFEAALAKTISAFLSALNAFGPRVNEKLEGLDFDDRAGVIEKEVELLKKTLATCNYLCVEQEDEELEG